MPAFDGCAHGLAVRQKVLSLEEDDLRLHQAVALELDAAERDHKWISRRHLIRQQRGGTDCPVHRMAERGGVDQTFGVSEGVWIGTPFNLNRERVGHSVNLEQPALYAGYFGAWFGGLQSDAAYSAPIGAL